MVSLQARPGGQICRNSSSACGARRGWRTMRCPRCCGCRCSPSWTFPAAPASPPWTACASLPRYAAAAILPATGGLMPDVFHYMTCHKICCMCPAVLCTAAKASLPSHADTLQMERHAHSFVQLALCEEIISVLPGMLKQRTPYRRSRPGAKSWRGRRGVPAGPRRTRPWRPAPWRRRRSMGLSSAASARCLAVQRRPRGATVAAAALRAATGREPKGHQCAAACSSSCCGGMRGGSSLAAHQHGTSATVPLRSEFHAGNT